MINDPSLTIEFEPEDFYKFYRVPELAKIFNVNPRIIRKWLSDGDLRR